MFWFRTLTADQKALIMAYAELDKEVNGSVEGIVKTNKGMDCWSLTCSCMSYLLKLWIKILVFGTEEENFYCLFTGLPAKTLYQEWITWLNI